MPLPNRIPVVHRVERSNLVDTHRRHLQHARDLIHHAQAAEAVLPLPEVEKRHHGRLLVLRRVTLEDLVDELVVLLGELEGDAGIVDGSISMLQLDAVSICELEGSFEVPYDLERMTGNSGAGREGTNLGS